MKSKHRCIVQRSKRLWNERWKGWSRCRRRPISHVIGQFRVSLSRTFCFTFPCCNDCQASFRLANSRGGNSQLRCLNYSWYRSTCDRRTRVCYRLALSSKAQNRPTFDGAGQISHFYPAARLPAFPLLHSSSLAVQHRWSKRIEIYQ